METIMAMTKSGTGRKLEGLGRLLMGFELKRIFFNPYLHIFYFCSERFEVNSVFELHFGLFYFFWIIRDDCRLLYLCLHF